MNKEEIKCTLSLVHGNEITKLDISFPTVNDYLIFKENLNDNKRFIEADNVLINKDKIIMFRVEE